MTRNYIVNIHTDPDTKKVVTTPDPVQLLVNDTVQWFSAEGDHQGQMENDPKGNPFSSTQPWSGKQNALSSSLKAVNRGRFKYSITVSMTGGSRITIDPEVIVT